MDVNAATQCSREAQRGSSHVPLQSRALAGPCSCAAALGSCLGPVDMSGGFKVSDSHGSLLCAVLPPSACWGRADAFKAIGSE